MKLTIDNIKDLDGFVKDVEGEPLDCTIAVEVEFDLLIEERQLFISDWRVVDFSCDTIDEYLNNYDFMKELQSVVHKLAFDKRLQEIAEVKTEKQIERLERVAEE